MPTWSLFSNHGHVLLVLSQHPGARLRDVASQVGITERAVQKIVKDLQDDGVLTVTKRGRRNRYRINSRKTLRHPLDVHRTVGQLMAMMQGKRKGGVAAATEPEAAQESSAAVDRRAPKEPESAPAVAAKPESAQKKARESEAKQPEPKQPEPKQPEPKKPEPKKPASDRPEPGKSGSKKQAPKTPQATKPEVKKPAPRKSRKKPASDDQQGSLF